jgi:hypothetical protein
MVIASVAAPLISDAEKVFSRANAVPHSIISRVMSEKRRILFITVLF